MLATSQVVSRSRVLQSLGASGGVNWREVVVDKPVGMIIRGSSFRLQLRKSSRETTRCRPRSK